MTSLRTLRSATARVVVPTAAVAAALLAFAAPGSAAVTTQVVEGNPTCSEVAPGTTEIKHDANPADGTTLQVGTAIITINKSSDEQVSWSSPDLAINAVIMKGGPTANVYEYDPAANSGSDLTTATNPNNGKPYGISHVSFCYGLASNPPPQNTPPQNTPAPETPAPQNPAPAPQNAAPQAAAPQPAQVLGVQLERAADPTPAAAPAVQGAQLAATGAETTTMAIVGIALVGIGTALLPVTRRRRTASPSDAG